MREGEKWRIGRDIEKWRKERERKGMRRGRESNETLNDAYLRAKTVMFLL